MCVCLCVCVCMCVRVCVSVCLSVSLSLCMDSSPPLLPLRVLVFFLFLFVAMQTNPHITRAVILLHPRAWPLVAAAHEQ